MHFCPRADAVSRPFLRKTRCLALNVAISPPQSARPPVHPVLTLYCSVGLSLFQGSGLFFRSQLQGVMGPSAPVRSMGETAAPLLPRSHFTPTSAPSPGSLQK